MILKIKSFFKRKITICFLIVMIFVLCIYLVISKNNYFDIMANITHKSTEKFKVYFLKTQIEGFYTNEAILFKTADGKIVMIDTANNNQSIYNVISKRLESISDNDTKKIDYLIISHSHDDHAGNLEKILKDNDINVKNIIYKNEKHGTKYNGKTIKNIIEESIINKNVNVIETTNLKNDRYTIKINDDVSMSLFNLNDVYKNYSEKMCKIDASAIKFHSRNDEKNININGNYVYLDNMNPNNTMLKYTKTYIKDKFYAYKSPRTTKCNGNANSIAVLFEIKTNRGKKYVYIPSDLENNGYSIFGNYSKTAVQQNFKYGTIYGNGTTYWFKLNNNTFDNGEQSVKVASESRIANKILKYIGEENVNNIIIYQQSHHGMNNAKDAIDTLNLNRKNVYAIGTYSESDNTDKDGLISRSKNYTLSKAKIKTTGVKGQTAIYCYIKFNAAYNCYPIK